MNAKRIQMEFKSLNEKSPGRATAEFVEDNINNWNISFPGPAGTPYEGFRIKLHLTLPAKYPHQAPDVRVSPPIFHPNVDENGDICWGEDHYKASMHILDIVQIIIDMLKNPNIEKVRDMEAGKLYAENRPQFDKIVKQKLASTHSKL